MKHLFLPSFLLLASMLSSSAAETFYLGTYTKAGGSRGIYQGELDAASGEAKILGLAAESISPSFLALHPNGRLLYAVNEVTQGTVSAFAIQPDGQLHELNRETSRGKDPTHLSVDREGKNVLIANYSSGSFAVLPILEDGRLGPIGDFLQQTGHGPNPQRQEAPHAHSIYVDASGKDVYACDLGMDHVLHYRLDAPHHTVTPAEPPYLSAAPGSGPRHLAFSQDEKFVYLAEEMGNHIAVLRRDPATGNLQAIQEAGSLPADFHGESTLAEVVLHPNGRFLFASNRGLDSIAAFAVEAGTGKLTLLRQTPTGGKNPRFFTIDPSGKFLLVANQDTNNVVIYRINDATGELQPTGHTFSQAQPVCIVFTRQ